MISTISLLFCIRWVARMPWFRCPIFQFDKLKQQRRVIQYELFQTKCTVDRRIDRSHRIAGRTIILESPGSGAILHSTGRQCFAGDEIENVVG